MNPRTVIILVVVACIISAGIVYLIMKPLPSSSDTVATEVKDVQTEQATTPAAGQPSAVDVNYLLAQLDVGTKGQGQKILDAFKKIMNNEPPYYVTGASLGNYAAKRGRFEESIEMTKKEISGNPEFMPARYTLAWIYTRMGNYAQATTTCTEALAINPQFREIKFILAWIDAKQGRPDEALKKCEELISNDPGSWVLHHMKGRLQQVCGKNEEAVASYRRALELKPDSAETYLFLGTAYVELGRYDDAVGAFKKAVFYNPIYKEAFLWLGIAYDAKGNYPEAIKAYKESTTLYRDEKLVGIEVEKPIKVDNEIVYNRIGILSAKLGKYDDAVDMFKQAIAVRSDYAPAYHGLTLAYLLLGNTSEARKSYTTLKGIDAKLADSLSSVVEGRK